jgi:hypothetical protein
MNACPHCGAEVGADDEECWNCGGNLVVGRSGSSRSNADGRSERPTSRGGGGAEPPWRRDDSQTHSEQRNRERTRRRAQPAHEQTPEARNDQPRDAGTDRRQPVHRHQHGDRQATRQGESKQGATRQQTARTPDQPSVPNSHRQQSPESNDQPRGAGPLSRRQLLAGGGALAVAAAGGWFVFLRGTGTGPGDSFESATMLRAGEHGPYEISEGERHYFGVALREGEQLSVELSFGHTDGDLDLAVHGPDAPDSGGDELNSATSTTDNEQLRVTAQETGTYFVVPYGYGNNGNEYELTLEITETGGQTSPATPGETVADAPLTPAGTHGPYELSGGEEHYFAVELSQSDRLSVSITFDHNDADLDLAVQAPDGSEIASSNSTTDDESVSVIAPTDGTHTVQVYPYDQGTAAYDLSVGIE